MIRKEKIYGGIFKLMIFCIPFQLFPFFRFLQGVPSVTNSLIIAGAGITLLVFVEMGLAKKALQIDVFVRAIAAWAFYQMVSTLLVSLLLYNSVGELWGETTLTASASTYIYMIVLVLVLCFFSQGYQYISKQALCAVIDKIVWIVLIVGYMQLAILFMPFLRLVYDALNIENWAASSALLVRMGRICTTGTEPSSMGLIIGVLVAPYLLAQILTGNKKKRGLFCAFLPVLFFSYSSTAYIAIALNSILFLTIKFSKQEPVKRKTIVQIVFILLFLVCFALCFFDEISNSFFGEQIRYYLFEKVQDQHNMSSMYRTSTVINDFKIFLDHPILGVGNGNQGFWYAENIPVWTMKSLETQNALLGKVGVVNGGAFIPAYISAYGLTGILALFAFIYVYGKTLYRRRSELGPFYYMAIIGGITFLGLASMSTAVEGNFYFYFLLSIPMIASCQSGKNVKQGN